MENRLTLCAAGLLAAAVTVGGVAVSESQAAVVFRDNFENVTGGSAPYPEADLDGDPIAQTGVWTITEAGPTSVQVSTDYSPIDGTRALVMNRNGAANDIRANFANAVPAAPADPVHISFKYRDVPPDPAFSGATDCMEVYGYNDNDTGYDNQVFGIRIFKGWGNADDVYVGFAGTASFGNPGNSTRFINAAGQGPASVWQQVDITMDFTTNTYDFALNGSTLAGTTDIPFSGDAASATEIQQLMFYHFYSSAPSRFAIDDLTVTAVPEPTTAAILLGLGSAGVLRRRRTK